MKRYLPLFLIFIFSTSSAFCTQQLSRLHSKKETISISYLAMIPESFADILALEFKGIISDYLMLNTLSFMGDKIMNKKDVEREEWTKVYHALKLIIHLDPRATDPYVLAETTLPWEPEMIEETNQLLLQIAKVQTHNPQPYFFLWFNHYYFLNDPETAGKYLQKSAKIPGSPTYYSTLAARMHMLAGHHTEGIHLLQEIINETTDPKRREFLNTRLYSLKILNFLETNILRYKKIYNKMPETIEDLVHHKVIKSVPQDPYGGTFFINEKGRVYTTSKLVKMKKEE